MSLRLCLLAVLAALLAVIPAAPAGAHRDKSPEVVARGLDNPRGLAVTPHVAQNITKRASAIDRRTSIWTGLLAVHERGQGLFVR